MLNDALRSAQQDGEWEQDIGDSALLRSGEIRITATKGGDILQTTGAGLLPTKGMTTVIPVKDAPAISSKNVKARDIYLAGAQHNTYGLELKPLPSSLNRNDKGF